jgi:hypothetical protein
MKKQIKTISAVPSKRLYLSIISDYGLNQAICELVDNALDAWVIAGRTRPVSIEITLDEKQQTILIVDNAGGVKPDEIKNVVAPGHTGTKTTDELIGIFGVGTKRAVVALAEDIKITTRYQKGGTCRVEISDEWLQEETWDLPVYEVDAIAEGSTRIDLSRLRIQITPDAISDLREHAGATYATFLAEKLVTISINTKPVTPILFENWAYPPEYAPRRYKGVIPTQDGKKVAVEVVAGLINESSPAAGEYGVYFYCNGRLIARGMKNHDVGFTAGLIGLPHPRVSLVRAIVRFNGDAQLMPWNSSKSWINTHHQVFLALQAWIINVLKDYAYISRTWVGEWPERVFKHSKGTIVEISVPSFPEAKKSYLPPLPRAILHFADVVEQLNHKISAKKPWVRGLYEGVIAADLIFKKKWEQKNRIALVLLDSTLEIAFKEYLVNDSGVVYSDSRLLDLFRNRSAVHSEIKKYVKLSPDIWKRIEYYYRLRCKLIHERASVGITDPQLEEYQRLTEVVLKKIHKLNFRSK